MLEVGQEYTWIFSAICDRSDRSLDMVVTGKVQRIVPDNNLTNKLKNASLRERAALEKTMLLPVEIKPKINIGNYRFISST